MIVIKLIKTIIAIIMKKIITIIIKVKLKITIMIIIYNLERKRFSYIFTKSAQNYHFSKYLSQPFNYCRNVYAVNYFEKSSVINVWYRYFIIYFINSLFSVDIYSKSILFNKKIAMTNMSC